MTAATQAQEARQPRWLLDSERFVGMLFLAPAILYIILLVGLPFVIAILFSMTDVNVGDTSLDFVGFQNFENVVQTQSFQRALRNSFLFTFISQFFIIILANIQAIVLTQEFRGKWLVRFIFILPWATPVALGVIGWLFFLDPTGPAPIEWALIELGLLPGRSFNALGEPLLAQISIILIQVWRMTPLAAVILMAGLTSIPQDILDQAEVDGSRFWRTLFQVKLPMILPIMTISLLFSTIYTFGDMTVVYILTRGGPIDHTQVLPTWAYFVGIEGGNLAQGAAIALFLFPVLLVVAVVMLRFASRTEVY